MSGRLIAPITVTRITLTRITLTPLITTLVAVAWLSMTLGCAPLVDGASRVDGTDDRLALAPVASGVAAPPAPTVAYRPPVAAPVRDGFRPPATSFGAGNRGIEYATTAGQPVWAAADGMVVFAGAVAGTLAVSIQHADGLRTTYTHLDETAVSAGARVGRGQLIGSATDRVHFGARFGSAYLDPSGLFESVGGPARLVPDADLGRRGRPPSASVVPPY